VDQSKPCVGGAGVFACAELGGRNKLVPVDFKEKALGDALLDQLLTVSRREMGRKFLAAVMSSLFGLGITTTNALRHAFG
jgi:hypothetical protein